jgi:DNA replication and repair protein RecF
MYLVDLSVINFKNYSSQEFQFHSNVNAILGRNGTGKTNLLDAIHYLAFTKSYFPSQDIYSVKNEEDFFAIHGHFHRFEIPENSTKISCTYKNNRKTMKANQKEYSRLSDHYGLYPLVMISPYDHDIINEGSDVRRKFFDMIISQIDKEYLQHLIRYQKLLTQKNTTLKQLLAREHQNYSLLEIYNEQLSPLANKIFNKRKEFIHELSPGFEQYYRYISDGNETVEIRYQSQLENESFDKGIGLAQQTDIQTGYSTFGTHRDDFNFIINNKPLKRFGSQGQQKSFALAIKLAQFDFIYEKKKIKPLLLLDDIFDKIDPFRSNQLITLVGEHHFGQVFLTDTDPNRVEKIFEEHQIPHHIILVEQLEQKA